MGLLSTIGAASGRAFGFTRSAIAAAVDQYFNLTTLLLPGNGTNGAQNNTFLDSSTNNFTITRNGNTTQGTFSPFSQTGWSNYFASSSGFRFADSADFSMGTNAFTIECFVYLTKTQSAGSGFISQWVDANDSNSSWQLGVDWSGGAGGNKFAGQISIGGTVTAINDTTNYALNTWHHVVLCRSGSPGTTALFVNGVRVASSTVTGSIVDATNPVGIGVRGGSDSYYQDGVYISNVRVVNGTDVYGATNTTLTVPTAPLTAVTNTKLLTCQSNRFLDTNTQVAAKAVSQVLGTPSVQAFSPFAPTAAYSAATNGGSGFWDGSGDSLTAPDNAAFDPGTGDFTFEAWVYHRNAASADEMYFSVFNGGFAFYRKSNGKLELAQDSVAILLTGATTITAGQWYHVVLTRVGTTIRIFVNGTQDASATNSTNFSGGTAYVGASSGGQTLNGYMSGARLLKGTGYTSITVPTAPPTAITNTSLLLNFTNAGITDATAKNDLETVGNAQISTTQSKFGGSSLAFDGTGDWLLLPASPNMAMGTGDFTFECWIYATAASDQPIYESRSTTGGTDGFTVTAFSSTVIRVYTNAVLVTATVSNYLNTWTHVAFTREGSTNRLFINGTLQNTATNSNNYSNQVAVVGGGRYNSNNIDKSFTGYIDDLRITKGYARYTASFTPPTAAFATQ